MKKKTHGGKRQGAGRPKLKKKYKKEPTVVMRIPKSKVEIVTAIIMESVCAKCGGTGIINFGPTVSRPDEPCTCQLGTDARALVAG